MLRALMMQAMRVLQAARSSLLHRKLRWRIVHMTNWPRAFAGFTGTSLPLHHRCFLAFENAGNLYTATGIAGDWQWQSGGTVC